MLEVLKSISSICLIFGNVGLSNILDSELTWRTPCEGPHGKVIGETVMDGELFCKVIQRIKAVAGVKPFLVLPVASFHFDLVAGRVGADALVPDPQFGGSGFKARWVVISCR